MIRRNNYATLEETFDNLPDDIKEHSRRVEKYADLAFMELCATEEYIMNMNSRVRLRYENREMIGIAARYHDVGKILVPEVYHWMDADFSEEETALYLRHTLGGKQLVKDFYTEERGISPILTETVCEGVSGHHEFWDGTGTPSHLKGEDIPIVGRIVAIADELDHLLMTTRTETPVATAIDAMMMQSGTRFDPVIMGLLYEAKHKIEKIFALYREDSRAIPPAPHVLKRKNKRPMWLKYRPIMEVRTKRVYAVESDMVFRRGKSEIPYSEAEALLKRSKKLWEIQLCFIAEAADMVRRIRNCEIECEFVALHCVKGFWKRKGAAAAVIRMLESIDAEIPSLGFIISAEESEVPSPNLTENAQKFSAAGCKVLYNCQSLVALDENAIKDMGVTHLRIDTAAAESIQSNIDKIKRIEKSGITVIGARVNKRVHAEVLDDGHVAYASGSFIGDYETENEFIAGELATAQAQAQAVAMPD